MNTVRLFGFLLQAAGILVAGTSGLCSIFTLWAFITTIPSTSTNSVAFNNLIGFAIVFLSIGVFSFFCGLGLFLAGRSIDKSAKGDTQRR